MEKTGRDESRRYPQDTRPSQSSTLQRRRQRYQQGGQRQDPQEDHAFGALPAGRFDAVQPRRGEGEEQSDADQAKLRQQRSAVGGREQVRRRGEMLNRQREAARRQHNETNQSQPS